MKRVVDQRSALNTPKATPLIPTTIFPPDNLNPEPEETLPCDKVTCPEAFIIVPYAYALKEAITSQPALISAPIVKLPSAFAQY